MVCYQCKTIDFKNNPIWIYFTILGVTTPFLFLITAFVTFPEAGMGRLESTLSENRCYPLG
jgi:hypothetical protein